MSEVMQEDRDAAAKANGYAAMSALKAVSWARWFRYRISDRRLVRKIERKYGTKPERNPDNG